MLLDLLLEKLRDAGAEADLSDHGAGSQPYVEQDLGHVGLFAIIFIIVVAIFDV